MGEGEYIKRISNIQIAMKVSWLSIIINTLLSVYKLLAGILSNSSAMVSDAVHTISDVLSSIIVIIGIKMSYKEADSKHPYGHERFESVAAIILSVILFFIGVSIGFSGIKKIILNKNEVLTVPGTQALVAALVSIIIKEIMYWYTRIAAKKVNSDALMADAWHHRSDALSSIGSFIGIMGAKIGFLFMDPLASVVICLLITVSAISIFIDAIGKMIDKSCDRSIIEEMKNTILQEEGVICVDLIRARMFGNRIYVDVEIRAKGDDTLLSTHELAHRVHDVIEKNYENVKHCMVHVNPEI
ncbi:cation diffusion facilitator family transporter [Herbinix luporum]|jgi:cation diffusion facilitator family transporter|uniref:Putative membrane protein n=1 Tax=Herbinix luporum TaxID=1679721 RepID=A0A0K8J509_9FIRM|nr:cation diffusion facilitator family transporter [Herbinix luporum]CUH92746.1 putative membrane protein [Herbinix luporum]